MRSIERAPAAREQVRDVERVVCAPGCRLLSSVTHSCTTLIAHALQWDEPEEAAGPPLSSAMRSTSSLSPVMVQAVVGERNRLRVQVQRLTRELERVWACCRSVRIALATIFFC